MTWVTPPTFVLNQVPTASDLNKIRDDLVAIRARVDPTPMYAWADDFNFPETFPFGDGVDHYSLIQQQSFALWFDPPDVDGTPQWRIRARGEVTVIVPGSPSAVSWSLRVRSEANALSASGAGSLGVAAVGVAQAITNTTGYKSVDSGFVSIVATGLRCYTPSLFTNRTGGSGSGSIRNVAFFPQVRAV